MSLMWTEDAGILAARKHPGWATFHRECGLLNFVIDTVSREGVRYRADCSSWQHPRAPWISIVRAPGFGATPIEACIDGYRKAVDTGHMADTHLEVLFAPPEDSLDDMIGEAPEDALLAGVRDAFCISYVEQAADYAACFPADEDEDLIG